MTIFGFAKAMTISTFAGAAVGVGGVSYGLLFPHPVSMFFSVAHHVSNVGLVWAAVSFLLFIVAMTIQIWREI